MTETFRDLLPSDIEELKDIIEFQKTELLATKNILKRNKYRTTVNTSVLSTSNDYISVDFHYNDSVLKTIKKRYKKN